MWISEFIVIKHLQKAKLTTKPMAYSVYGLVLRETKQPLNPQQLSVSTGRALDDQW